MIWFPAAAQLLGAVASLLWPLLGYAFLLSMCFCAWLGYRRAQQERREAKVKAEPEGVGRQWRIDTLIGLISRVYPWVQDDEWTAHADVVLDSRMVSRPAKLRIKVLSSTGAHRNG